MPIPGDEGARAGGLEEGQGGAAGGGEELGMDPLAGGGGHHEVVEVATEGADGSGRPEGPEHRDVGPTGGLQCGAGQ